MPNATVIKATTPSSFRKQSLIVVNNQIFATDRHGMLWAYVGDDIFNDSFDGP